MSNGFPTAMPRLPDKNPATKSADMERRSPLANIKQFDRKIDQYTTERGSANTEIDDMS